VTGRSNGVQVGWKRRCFNGHHVIVLQSSYWVIFGLCWYYVCLCVCWLFGRSVRDSVSCCFKACYVALFFVLLCLLVSVNVLDDHSVCLFVHCASGARNVATSTQCSEKEHHSRFLLYLRGKCFDFYKIFGICLWGITVGIPLKSKLKLFLLLTCKHFIRCISHRKL